MKEKTIREILEDFGEKYSECMCEENLLGKVDAVMETRREIIAIAKSKVPKKKVCMWCNDTKELTDAFGDKFDCPHCYLVFQWNQAIDETNKGLDSLRGE